MMNEDEREMRTIRIRNLFDNKINEELLYELFLQAGPINSITMPISQNGRKTMAIIEYTHEVAVPYALFIFEGTELYGTRLYMSSCNNNPPPFCIPKDAMNQLPAPAPFNDFNSRNEPFNSRNEPFHSRNESFSSRNEPFNSRNEPFHSRNDPFNSRFEPPPQMMMNVSNSSFAPEPNFDALLQMAQTMLIPPPMGFGGSSVNLSSYNNFTDNRHQGQDNNPNQRRNDERGRDNSSHRRDNSYDRRDRDDSYNRRDRDHSRGNERTGRHKHKHRR